MRQGKGFTLVEVLVVLVLLSLVFSSLLILSQLPSSGSYRGRFWAPKR